MKFLLTVDLSNNIFSPVFTILHDWDPYQWIFWILGFLVSRHDEILHFKGLSRKTKNYEVFDDRGPVTKCHFLLFSQIWIFGVRIMDFGILGTLMSRHDSIFHFKGLQKIQNISFFLWPRPCRKKLSFCCLHNFAYLGSKSVTFRIPGILMSTHDDILHFKGFSRKSKKKKKKKNTVFEGRGPIEKLRFFCCFHNITYIWDPNQWIFGFQISWCQDMMIFFVFKGFPWPWTSWKMLHFTVFTILYIWDPNKWISGFQVSWCQDMMFLMTADLSKKCHFLLFSQVCIFGIKISEVLDFRVPGVKTWW